LYSDQQIQIQQTAAVKPDIARRLANAVEAESLNETTKKAQTLIIVIYTALCGIAI
jgi:hypothetical protein